MDKKGNVQDFFLLGLVLFSFSIAIILGFKLFSEVNNGLQNVPLFTSNAEATASTTKILGYFPTVFDNGFLFLTVGMALISLILASLVRIHPIFIPLFLIALIGLVVFSAIISNIYNEISINENLTNEVDQLFFINHIMRLLPFIVGIFGTILMVVSYKLWQNAQEF